MDECPVPGCSESKSCSRMKSVVLQPEAPSAIDPGGPLCTSATHSEG